MGKTREQILDSLKSADGEEGRTGLVDAFLKDNPEKPKAKKVAKKDKK